MEELSASRGTMSPSPIGDALASVIHKIHNSGAKAALCITGAGSLAASNLLGVAGASRSIVDIQIPYSQVALRHYLGGESPRSYVSASTAKRMADVAHKRAQFLMEAESRERGQDLQLNDAVPIIGIGCTATIATDRTKKGEHAAHVAAMTALGCTLYSVRLDKEAGRERHQEEAIVSGLVVRALAEACGVPFSADIPLTQNEPIEMLKYDFAEIRAALDAEGAPQGDPVADLARGAVGAVLLHKGRAVAGAAWTGGLVSGSFNPLHEGHLGLAEEARRALGGADVAFELSIVNADKPALAEAEIRRRAAQFAERPLLLTRAPLFVEKARLFPGSTMVVGHDTYERLVNPKYYGGGEGMRAALEEIRAAGCSFLVAGRKEPATGEFRALAGPEQGGLFRPLPFRLDLSSTELRARAAAAAGSKS